jgi:hypothetical protein
LSSKNGTGRFLHGLNSVGENSKTVDRVRKGPGGKKINALKTNQLLFLVPFYEKHFVQK